MNYDALVDTVLSSSPSEWTRVAGRVAPQFVGEVSAGDQRWLEVAEHDSRWVLKQDVQISLAYGMDSSDPEFSLSFPLMDKFSDPKITGIWVEMQLNGVAIRRVQLILVDGARAVLPTPRNVVRGDSPADFELVGYSTTRAEVTLARLVDELNGRTEFDSYLERSGMMVEITGDAK